MASIYSNLGDAAKTVDLNESAAAIFDHFYEAGWTYGLPIVPPTPDLVEATLRYTDRPRHEVIATIEPRSGQATVEKIAINAVMAGCKPEYLPVVITPIEAMVEPQYNWYGRQTTTHPGGGTPDYHKWSHSPRAGSQLPAERVRPGLASQCHHRTGNTLVLHQHWRWYPRCHRHGDPRTPRQVLLLYRRRRRGQSLGFAACGARAGAGHKLGDSVLHGSPSQHQ